MRFGDTALLGLVAQVPLGGVLDRLDNTSAMRRVNPNFKFKGGDHVLTPKEMLELPRPGVGVVNEAEDLILVPVSQYSFGDKKNSKKFYITSVNGQTPAVEIPLATGGDVFWLDSRTIGHAVSVEDHNIQELHAISVKVETQLITPEPSQLIGKLPTTAKSPASNFVYRPGAQSLVFSAYVYSDWDLSTVAQQDEEYEDRGNSAFLYDDTYTRHWDFWRGPKAQTLWMGKLHKSQDGWKLGSEFTSPLKKSQHYTPVEPFGGTDDFSVSDTHIVYTTKDPKLSEADHTKQNVYVVELKDGPASRELTSGKQGATHAPVFNHAGDKVAWLELAEDGYEADRAKVILYDLAKNVRFTITEKWDRSPSEIHFSPDDKFLYMTVGDHARVKIYGLDVPETPSSAEDHVVVEGPITLTHTGAASGIRPLKDGQLVFTRSTLTSPNDVFIISPTGSDLISGVKERQLTSFSKHLLEKKSLHEGEEIWWDGAKQKIQGWVVTPPGFKKGDEHKWPVVMLIHGGPQGAWEDQWSTRWNPNVWASAGYVVFAPNPTGSTTFGQELTDAIAEDWGGAPFDDMRAGWAKFLKEYPEVDPERAVAAGASWGGYAINWIQGHPEFGFGFKALVCHDGVFDSNYNGFSTDELFFFNHEWGGRPFEEKSRALSEKMSPAKYVHKWSTPQLIIHGSKDYRLPDTEGLAAFHALQQLGVPSRLLIFPDENHWVLKHGNSLKWHYEVFRWLDEWVGKDD